MPADLERGDRIIFIKDERNTIFDELVEYYGHRPETLEIIKMSELWRGALKDHAEAKGLNIAELKAALENAGLKRTEFTIESWLKGKVICPSEGDYYPIDVITAVTGNPFLLENKNQIKAAARKVHSMHIKIGRHLAKRIVQSVALKEDTGEDAEFERKLDKASSYAEIAEVEAMALENIEISPELANKLLGMEDF